MATDFQNNFSGGTPGQNITTANSGGASGNAFSFVIVGTGGSTQYYTHGGETRARLVYGSSSSYLRWDDSTVSGGDTRRVVSVGFYYAGAPTGSLGIANIRTASDQMMGGLEISSAGVFRTLNSGWGTISGSPTTALAVGYYRAELAITSGAGSTGRVESVLYDADENVVKAFDSGPIATREDNPARARFGENNSTNNADLIITEVRSASRAAGWLGPITTAVVVETGPDQYDVEPLSTVTLNATASGDVDTWTWTQTAGPAVSITGQGTDEITFTAPALTTGATITFEVTGDDSAPASVTVTVLPHVYFILIGDTWRPATRTVVAA